MSYKQQLLHELVLHMYLDTEHSGDRKGIQLVKKCISYPHTAKSGGKDQQDNQLEFTWKMAVKMAYGYI